MLQQRRNRQRRGLIVDAAPGEVFDYYVDAVSGDDGNDGLTPDTAWKTMNKLANTSFVAGDRIGLKRGDVWREQWTVNDGGAAGNPVTYGAYGSGAAPQITGCDLLATWASANIGAGLFSDGFETGDISRWSTSVNPGGQLTVGAAGALVGANGLSVSIAGSVHAYVQDNTPANETTYRCRFYVDPNGLTMAGGNEFIIARALTTGGAASVFFVKLQKASPYGLFIFGRDDAFVSTSWTVPITDAPHLVELEWKSATAPGVNDGIWGASVDGVSAGRVTNLDSDTLQIDQFRLGAELELDAGTTGTLYVDGFYSNNTGAAIGASDPAVLPIYKAPYAESIDTYLLLEDGEHLSKVASLGALTAAGQYFPDNANNLIYAWATDGTDPDTHAMEIGARYEAVVCDDRSHLVFEGLHFHGAGGQYGRGFGLKPTFSTPADVTLRSCEISHCAYNGVQVNHLDTFDPVSGFLMDNCRVHDNLDTGVWIIGENTSARFTGIQFNNCRIYNNGLAANASMGLFIQNCAAPIITGCLIYDNNGSLDWSDNLLLGGCSDVVVTHNTVYGGNHSGIHLDVNTYGSVHLNVVYGCTWNGIWIEEHQSGAGSITTLYHNTCWHNLHGLVFGPGSTIFEVSGVTAKNNILAFNRRANVELNEDGGGASYLNNTLDYNVYQTDPTDPLYQGEFRAESPRVNKSFAQWKTYTSWDAHSADADPLLVDPASLNFHLQALSPAKNTGVDVGLTHDFEGSPMGAPDIGAYAS